MVLDWNGLGVRCVIYWVLVVELYSWGGLWVGCWLLVRVGVCGGFCRRGSGLGAAV